MSFPKFEYEFHKDNSSIDHQMTRKTPDIKSGEKEIRFTEISLGDFIAKDNQPITIPTNHKDEPTNMIGRGL